MQCVELVTHLWFRYSFSSAAPSSSQVQDTRFSSLEQGFESPWGHVQRHAAISIAACVVLVGMDALCLWWTGKPTGGSADPIGTFRIPRSPVVVYGHGTVIERLVNARGPSAMGLCSDR